MKKILSKTKLIGCLALVIIMMFSLVGCTSSKSEEEEIKTGVISLSEAGDGLYIMTADGELYQPNKQGQNFDKETTTANADRIIVSHENQKYIPKFYKDDKLVYFASTADGVPTSYTVEKFRNGGYTIGVYGLEQASSGYYTFKADNLLDNSNMKELLSEQMGSDILSLISIDDDKITDSMVNKAGCIDDMDEDEKVTIGVMKGTHYKEYETIADTVVYYSVSTHSIGTYKTTKNGYIEIELPKELTSGYVSINNSGIFQIMEENRPTNEE